jgi:hypothetical protein
VNMFVKIEEIRAAAYPEVKRGLKSRICSIGRSVLRKPASA